MLFGPAGNNGMIPSTMVFHTDNDGTIQSISYTYSIYNSSKGDYEKGTETLTFAYDTAAVNPTTADLSSAIKAYVAPTSWKEQSEAIYKDIVSAVGETEAATVPFLFDSNYAEDGWVSQYNPNGFTMIVGSSSSSSAATTFLNNYLTYVQNKDSNMEEHNLESMSSSAPIIHISSVLLTPTAHLLSLSSLCLPVLIKPAS